MEPLSYAISLLTKKDYSKYKLKKKLLEKNYERTQVENTLDKLISLKYLKEDEYLLARVKFFVRKGYSKEYILNRLKEEKLEVELDNLASILEELNHNGENIIMHLITKKYSQIFMPDKLNDISENSFEADQKIKIKLINFLYSRGFKTQDTIHLINDFLNKQKRAQ